MVLPNIDIINGVSGLEIILCGYILAFVLIFKHARKAPNAKVKKRIILRGVGMFSVYQAWFGTSTSFVLMMLGLPPLGWPNGIPNVGVLGYAWGPALGIPIWSYVAMDTLKESSYKKRVQIFVTLFMVIISLIFVFLIYTDFSIPAKYTKWQASPGGLPETGIRSTALYLLVLMLVIMMIFLGPSMIYSGRRMDDRGAKWKRYSIGVGLTLASLFGIIDAGLGADELGFLGLAIVKAFIFTSIFLIYEGVDKGV
jgi:hypothetical protein